MKIVSLNNYPLNLQSSYLSKIPKEKRLEENIIAQKEANKTTAASLFVFSAAGAIEFLRNKLYKHLPLKQSLMKACGIGAVFGFATMLGLQLASTKNKISRLNN